VGSGVSPPTLKLPWGPELLLGNKKAETLLPIPSETPNASGLMLVS